MKKHIEIEGMSCEHCVKAVKNVLEELGGTDITVDLSGGLRKLKSALMIIKLLKLLPKKNLK